MEIAFDNLKEIPKLVALLEELIKLQKEGTVEKKWLSVEETAYYLGYSKHKVYKLIQEEWIEGVHYHKPTGRVIVDKSQVNAWVQEAVNTSNSNRIGNLINDITKN